MIYSIYFSPTGNTKKVADIFANVWQEKVTEIDLSRNQEDFAKYQFQQEDLCIVSVPSYGGRVPQTAVKRIQSISASGTKAVLVVVYGNRHYDDTLLELKEVLEEKTFQVIGAVAAVAEHSVMREIAAGRPDENDRKELESFAFKIKEKYESKLFTIVEVPGNHPFREYNGIPLKPEAEKGCTACGLCAEKCPVGAISTENPKITNKEICISCMRCISICPQHARKLNSLMLKVAGAKLKKQCVEKKENFCIL
ncbi:MAG: EFR1 family ferrodoxin [Lachnospiraceae bacterium]